MKKNYGGSETYLENVKKFSRFQHTIGFAQNTAEKMTDKDPVFLKTYYDFKAAVKKTSLLEKDIIHSHFIIPGFFAQQEGYFAVCSSHCLFSKEFQIAISDTQNEKEKRELDQAHYFFQYLEKEFYPQIEHLVVYTPYHQKELEELGAKPQLLSLPVDIKLFDSEISQKDARETMNLPDKFTILFLGRPTHLKGFHILAEAFDNFYKKNNSQLLIVGDFEKKGKTLGYSACVRGSSSRGEHIQTQIEGEILTLNHIPRNQIPMYFKCADVLVCPSLYETVGYVNLEAMASRIPVIGSNTGGIPHIISDRKTGLLFESGNAQELEFKLNEIKEDYHLRKEITENAWQFVQRFESRKTIQELDKFYESVLHK